MNQRTMSVGSYSRTGLTAESRSSCNLTAPNRTESAVSATELSRDKISDREFTPSTTLHFKFQSDTLPTVYNFSLTFLKFVGTIR